VSCAKKCLCVSWFQNLFEARRIIASWRRDLQRTEATQQPELHDPSEFAAKESNGKDAGFACLENAPGYSRFPTLRLGLANSYYVRKMGAGQCGNLLPTAVLAFHNKSL
jgi:hypothetical protein